MTSGYRQASAQYVRLSLFILVACLAMIPVFTASSAAPDGKPAVRKDDSKREKARTSTSHTNVGTRLWQPNGIPNPLATFLAAPAEEGIATFASDCTTPKTSFDLGETVCAIVTGAPLGSIDRAARRIAWVSPYGSVTQGADIVTDPQSGTYAVPAAATQTLTDSGGGTVTVDNRGKWRIYIISAADGSLREGTSFTVHDPTKAFVDLSVNQGAPSDQVSPGSSSVFELFVNNIGPNAATDVVLTDSIPNNVTFGSFVDHSGLGFSCGAPSAGVITCTLASLPVDTTAHLTLNYSVDTGTSPGTSITNLVNISSSAAPCAPEGSCELQPNDNSSTSTVTVASDAGSGNCTLNCPDNINAVADSTEGGQRGVHVTFDAAEATGACGAITATPASGSFFPVGTNFVSVTSENGGGSCSFVVTVEDTGSNPPTISCPASQTANADNACAATVSVGTATTSGDNVTLFATRSDGQAMYTCDANGTNCTRVSSDAPFPTGVTTITWIARSHDVPGPYADEDAEIAHRTGAASCSQTVTVNDTTPPTITAASQTASADASCQAAVPNFAATATVSDNCACNSSDTSQACDDRQDIVVTQSPAAGTIVGLGAHDITLSANDGSSNNGGAGNTTTIHVTFTVNDTTAPVITCPGNITTSTDPNTCAATVNPGTATASDNCDASASVTGVRSDSQPLNAPYPKGTTTITWTATDAAGNHSSCTQTITVNDTQNPVISCPANITTGTDPNSCSATVNPGTPTASDNCGIPTVAGVRSDGNSLNAPYPKGTTTITWTATDSSGNHSSCNQTITVNDTQAPVISCTADIIADFNPAVNGAVVTYTAPVGTDNCPGATTIQTAGLASGSTFPTGTTTNTFRVTDGAGLTATCSFKVTVAVTSIIGLDSVTITGAGYADSYSSAGGYAATKGSLANVLSNGTITIGGSGKVWGNVRSTRAGVNMTGASRVTGNATAGTTVSLSGSASVGGTKTNNALAPVMTLPSVAPCGPYSSASGISGTYSYNASTGDLTLSGVNIATLANGNYCFHNVTIGNSAQLKVNGPVVVKLTGVLNTSGASNLNNTTQIPSNLRILSSFSGSNGVVIGNSVSVYALIYAPTTSVNMSGAAPLFGTAAAKTITIGNSGAIHYDTQLKTVWPAIWALL